MNLSKNVKVIASCVSALIVFGCQTSGSENALVVGPAKTPMVSVSAPQFSKGDFYEYKDVIKGTTWTRKFKEKRGENLVFEMGGGSEAIYTNELSAIRIGNRIWKPNNGFLKFPLKVGTTWSHRYISTNNNDRERSCSVDKWVSVKVPAGTFPAFVINCSNQRATANFPALEEYWYAPDVKQFIWYSSGDFNQEFILTSFDLK
jgi:hypothetical protein